MLAVSMVTIDCENPRELAEFWTQALQTEITVDWDDFLVLGGEPALGLQRVDDPTPGKNRLHLDLSGGVRAQEVARLVELGADVVRTHDVDGFGWTVMVDPAGNEFCVGDPHGDGEGADEAAPAEGEGEAAPARGRDEDDRPEDFNERDAGENCMEPEAEAGAQRADREGGSDEGASDEGADREDDADHGGAEDDADTGADDGGVEDEQAGGPRA